MKRLGLICNLLPATLFLAATVASGLRAQDVLSALPLKPAAPPAAPAEEVNPTVVINRDEPNEAKGMHNAETSTPEMTDRQRAENRIEAFRARMLELFDQNKDGRLDEAERAAAKKYAEENGFGRGAGAVLNRDEILKRFDKNGNGQIDEDERPAMQAAMRDRVVTMGSPAEALRTEMRRRFDRNTNGKIDNDEMPALERALRSRLGSAPLIRQRYDMNGDGKIDDVEWAAARGPLQQWLNESAKN